MLVPRVGGHDRSVRDSLNLLQCQSVIPSGVMGPAAVDVFAVFDGLGPEGHLAADVVNGRLEKALAENSMSLPCIAFCLCE